MISKILITLGVIVACIMLISSRGKPDLREIPNPDEIKRRKQMRIAAFAFMAVMVLAAGSMIYLEVDKRNAVVTVHVINTQSGDKKSYRAMKSDIHGDGFVTLEGLQVFVAEIERIEIETR